MPIVDAHHHLWERRDALYAADELCADTAATHNVTHTVFVECVSRYDRNPSRPEFAPLGETRYVVEQAARMAALGGPRLGAIVGHADLTLGDQLDPVLDAHLEHGNGLFRGIRHATTHDPDPDMPVGHHNAPAELMRSPAFIEGVRRLGAHGLTYDAWLYHPQIDEMVELARACPETTMILDHLGGPMGIGPYADRHDEAMAAWRASIESIATCPNVVIKIGGIGMDNYYGTGLADLDQPADSDTVVEVWDERVQICIDNFGPNRSMCESNFPVDRESLTYPVLWNALQKMTERYSPTERADLFSGTATRVYRIVP